MTVDPSAPRVASALDALAFVLNSMTPTDAAARRDHQHVDERTARAVERDRVMGRGGVEAPRHAPAARHTDAPGRGPTCF